MKILCILSTVLLLSFVDCFSQVGTLDPSFGYRGLVNTNMTDVNKGNETIQALAIQPDGKIIAAGTTFSPSVIFRYNADGSLDNSFGNKGMAFCYGFRVMSIVLQNDGKILLASSNFQLARFNSNGTQDNSFGIDGRSSVSFGSYSSANCMAVQSDGKIVLAGSFYNGAHDDFAIARFNADGSPDNGFDNDGKIITVFSPSESQINGVAIQGDGKIIAAGTNYNGTNARLFALARYNADGSLDSGFDDDGKLTTSFGTSIDVARSVSILDNGKILAGGYSTGVLALARYNANGSLDNSFDGDGKLTTPMGALNNAVLSMTVLNDGKILAAGSSYYDFALVRLNSDGSLDNSLDGDGKVVTDFNSNYDESCAMVIQGNGKIILGGYGNSTNGNKDFAIVRYNTDGSLDNGFDGDGKLTYHFGTSWDIATSLAVQNDGKILVAGYTGLVEVGSNNDIAVIRYNTDGSIDSSFDIDGKVILDGVADNRANALAIQNDGKIVVAGTSTQDFLLARYNMDGSPDNSFDTDGKVTTNFISNSIDAATCMTIQTDGKIVLAGYTGRNPDWNIAVARYNPDGSPDNSFNGNGKVITSFLGAVSERASCMAVQTDGKIVVGGIGATSFVLLRYNTDGNLDNSFDGDGILSSNIAFPRSLTIQPDGKIVTVSAGSPGFVINRYNPDGSLDNSFDGDGVLTNTEVGGFPISVTIKNNGKIFVTGSWQGSYFLQYNGDGSADDSFDGDGKAFLSLAPVPVQGITAMRLHGNRIYVAGEIRSAGGSDFLLAAAFVEPPGAPSMLMVDFSGKLINDDALLSWNTKNEKNMLEFIVERSVDGRNFTPVGYVNARNYAGTNNYNLTDFNVTSLHSSVAYYRLKQKGLDGSFTWSRTIVLPIDKSIVLIYPNPVINDINIVFTTTSAKKVLARIVDNKGRLMKQQQWNLSAGNVSLTMNVDGLAKGIYYLQIKGDGIDYKKKFLK